MSRTTMMTKRAPPPMYIQFSLARSSSTKIRDSANKSISPKREAGVRTPANVVRVKCCPFPTVGRLGTYTLMSRALLYAA